MILDEVVERSGCDVDALHAAALAMVGDVPMVVGGSLADDLGHPGSDVDVYCFVDHVGPAPPCSAATPALLDLHLTPPELIDEAAALGHALLSDPAAYDLTGMSESVLGALHALALGTALHREDEIARLRLHARADLVSFHLASAALDAFAWLAVEAVALMGETDEVTELAMLVRAAEAAIDAALGAAGQACPNPKWRFALVRACGVGFPVPSDCVVATLLPGCADLVDPRATALATITAAVDHAADHPLLRPTGAANRARAVLADLRDAVASCSATTLLDGGRNGHGPGRG